MPWLRDPRIYDSHLDYLLNEGAFAPAPEVVPGPIAPWEVWWDAGDEDREKKKD